MINSALYRGTKILQKFKSHLKILGARMVSWNKSHTERPQILGASVQNLVARETWRRDLCDPDIVMVIQKLSAWRPLALRSSRLWHRIVWYWALTCRQCIRPPSSGLKFLSLCPFTFNCYSSLTPRCVTELGRHPVFYGPPGGLGWEVNGAVFTRTKSSGRSCYWILRAPLTMGTAALLSQAT